jgi:glycosyltransferase involved in cell wall biosynthesis
MKIYSYLHSGKPLVATDLPTHRQVLDESIAVLAAATPASFAAGLQKLLDDKNLRVALGTKARETAESLYTAEAFESQVSFLYEGVVASLKDTAPPPPPQRAASGGDLV